MSKMISVLFELNGMDMPVSVNYSIVMQGNIQVIYCSVSQSDHKNWLQLSKFELRSKFVSGIYTALFNDDIHKKNIATSLFVDKVYSCISGKKKMRVEGA